MNNKKQLSINVIFNFVYQMLLFVTPLITAPYISRILGPDRIGIYSYTQSLVTYFVLFAGLGTATYGVRKIALFRDDKKNYSKNFWEIEIINVATSLISIFIWLFFANFYTRYSIYLFIMTAELINVIFNISWFYQGLEKFQYTVTINAICRVLSVVAIFLFVKTSNDLPIYITISTCSTLLGSISMWLFLPRFVSRTTISLKDMLTHLKENIVYFLPAIASSIYTVLDKTLIGIITQDDVQNGYYEQATKIISICKSLCFISVTGVMTSRMSYLFGKNDLVGIKKSIKSTMNITLGLSIGACFGLIAVASRFVPFFYGEGYDFTSLLLKVLAGIVPIICISNVLGYLYLTPIGKIKHGGLFLVIGSGVNLLLNIPFIYFFSSLGAAIASIVAELIITILHLVYSRNIFSFADFISVLWKKIVAGGIMLLFVYLFNLYIGQQFSNVVLILAIDVVLGLLSYIAVLFILKDGFIKDSIGLLKK